MDNWTSFPAFLYEAVRDMRTTGAIAPSGASLARTLTADLGGPPGGGPLRVLEAGAGTGAVTRTLISRLPRGSVLDVVEANARFAERLRRLAAGHPALAGSARRVRVHHARVEEFGPAADPGRRYDAIVSGLPFTNFPPDQVEAVMDRCLALLAPHGTLTYFAYRGTRTARALFSSRAEARRHRAVEALLADYRRRYATGCRTVWANLPPARVWQLCPRPAARPAVLLPDRAGARR
ncbi:hypothetical protein GCM10010211_36410 [Streptomyces albospinus]|uniref:Methyltransferase domain-containing protein n=1 Tax=Streptomyces albospinus TaxID=285515 RepID=A0ABQ2V7Q7_9ACTN|nr:methyltransferase domain-containing protein [Streptomyces albospinus]GGU67707.1 hypothetical protein GCM10010211_36410 [Streptomyces albospinus]